MRDSKRKGARSKKDIPEFIMHQLNNGQIQSANLVEWLAIDQKLLLKSLVNSNARSEYLHPVLAKIEGLKKQTVNTINEAIGTELYRQADQNNDKEFLEIMSKHNADMVRCWACYAIGKNENLNIAGTLEHIEPFAADSHFGVREISWLAVRPKLAQNIMESIDLLAQWTKNQDENIRRFATESTRPRGVWCKYIPELQQDPELGLPLLEPLRSDQSKYVQNSVGNWLNDASKSQPDFVCNLCRRWERENITIQTQYIIKRALRTINKK